MNTAVLEYTLILHLQNLIAVATDPEMIDSTEVGTTMSDANMH